MSLDSRKTPESNNVRNAAQQLLNFIRQNIDETAIKMLQAFTLTASLRWTATCPKWLKKETCRQRYVLGAKSLSHGARNGRRIGKMSVFVQTVAAGHVDAGCADMGLKANGCV